MKIDNIDSEPAPSAEPHTQPIPEASSTSTSPQPGEVMASRSSYKKYLSLLVLIIQNTVLVLVMRYSRTVTVDGFQYLPTTAVVMAELLKLAVCVVMVWYDVHWSLSRGLSLLYTEIVAKKKEMLKVSVPSILYTIQNNLLYIALTYLDAATFQVGSGEVGVWLVLCC